MHGYSITRKLTHDYDSITRKIIFTHAYIVRAPCVPGLPYRRSDATMTMKFQLALCIAAAAVVCSNAAPSRWSMSRQDFEAKRPLDIWSDCSGPKAKAKLGNVSVIPDPPQKGHSLNVTVQLILFEDVSKGKVKVSLILDQFVPVYNMVYSFCDMVKDAGKKCPIKKGPVDIGINTMIPHNAPAGSYSGAIEVSDQTSQQLGCLKVHFKMN